MSETYDFRTIEPAWQNWWREHRTYAAPNPGQPGGDRQKYYVLNFFLTSHAGFEVKFLENFLAFLENAKVLPKAIMVNKDVAYDFFKPITDSLGIALKKVKGLEAVEDAKNALISSMAR